MNKAPIEVGPFTPQETDEICATLKSRGLSFEILKDDAEEKAFAKSDYLNIVNRAEFRTENYLGQIFYIKLNSSDYQKASDILVSLGFPKELSQNEKELETADMTNVHQAAVQKDMAKAWVARVIVGIILLYMVWVYKDLFIPLN